MIYFFLKITIVSKLIRIWKLILLIISHFVFSVPAYDKYGKELSNYERWKMQQSEAAAGYSSSSSSDSRYGTYQVLMNYAIMLKNKFYIKTLNKL